MAFITVSEAKQQCRITHDLEDDLLQTYIDAAIAYVQRFLNMPQIPLSPDVKAACLMIVADLYENREASVSPKSAAASYAANPAVVNLLHPHRMGIGI